MKLIDVKIKSYEKKYPILVGLDLIKKIEELIPLEWTSKICIITDSNIPQEYVKKVKNGLTEFSHEQISTFIFVAGEKNKNLQTVEKMYEHFSQEKLDRKSLVINIGGGVTTDMGSFAASTFMRGIPFINIPTTLEAMVDASVGGKTGVNLGGFKNYIGTFTQPKAVIVDIETLKTVPKRALVQGFAEVIKHGLIADKNYFSKATAKPFEEFSQEELIDIIAGSIEIKSKIVGEDEKESGIRKVLNFGHTVGHAVESLSLKSEHHLFHGEAVAIGMIAEAKISELMGMLTSEEFEKIETAITQVPLPTKFKNGSYSDISKLLLSDKKNQSGKIKWVLLYKIGMAEFNIEVNESFVKQAVEYIL